MVSYFRPRDGTWNARPSVDDVPGRPGTRRDGRGRRTATMDPFRESASLARARERGRGPLQVVGRQRRTTLCRCPAPGGEHLHGVGVPGERQARQVQAIT